MEPMQRDRLVVVQKLWRNFFPGDNEPVNSEDRRVRMVQVFLAFFQDATKGKPLLSRVDWSDGSNVYLDCSALESLLGFHDFIETVRIQVRRLFLCPSCFGW